MYTHLDSHHLLGCVFLSIQTFLVHVSPGGQRSYLGFHLLMTLIWTSIIFWMTSIQEMRESTWAFVSCLVIMFSQPALSWPAAMQTVIPFSFQSTWSAQASPASSDTRFHVYNVTFECSLQCSHFWLQLSHVWATIGGVWIDNRIYWPLTTISLALSLFHTHCNSLQHAVLVSCSFTNPLVTASNGRCFPSYGFPNCSIGHIVACLVVIS
jgi:hypothetical protein